MSAEPLDPHEHLEAYAHAWGGLCQTLRILAQVAPGAYQAPELISKALAQVAQAADDLHTEWLLIDAHTDN